MTMISMGARAKVGAPDRGSAALSTYKHSSVTERSIYINPSHEAAQRSGWLSSDPGSLKRTSLQRSVTSTSMGDIVHPWPQGDSPSRLISQPSTADDPATAVFNRLVALKVITSQVAMHLQQAWRSGLFQSLDQLLDKEDWDFSDELPTEASFLTFLRMIIFLNVKDRPALGATSNGRIISGWMNDQERLQIECGPNDEVKWVIATWSNDHRESAAGRTVVSRLPQVLAAYKPERWFNRGL